MKMENKKATKNNLVDGIYNNSVDSKLEKQDILNVVDLFLDEVKKSLEEGKKIELRGFGTFEIRLRKGKSSARNPKTGQIVKVEPHYVAAFRAGQELRQKLWDVPVNPNSDK